MSTSSQYELQYVNKASRLLPLPDCFIYLYHTDEYFILPQYPASINDGINSQFQSQNALARTAPVFSYSNSGPRSVPIHLELHRDMMFDANVDNASIKLLTDSTTSSSDVDIADTNYISLLIKRLQTIVLPRYDATSSLVVPPMVAVKLGNEVLIKGVVSGGITVNYSLPLLEDGHYALATIDFTVSEVTPFDALSVGKFGSFRGLIAPSADFG